MSFHLKATLGLSLPTALSPHDESALSAKFGHRMAGIDEAGRGPWAGPVACAAVILDYQRLPVGLADSKTLKEGARDQLFEEICATAQVAVAFASPSTIDRLNIRAATLHAMAQAAHGLARAPTACLIDGRDVPPGLPCPGQSAIKGDGRLLCIAAASIVAKVTRDRLMVEMAKHWPVYGFAGHKGYGTAAHADALRHNGPCPLHRQSFKPVASARGGF